ncbi:MAG TPA: DUF2231 domain-containing protein [Gammaproteobacteria bacterium]|nr:DUF2231 domain-containing protein [Gammaproteobacteria bacterium]
MFEIIPNLHPILVHFTVALTATAVGLFIVARLLRGHTLGRELQTVARWDLWLAALATLFTVAAGLYAYGTVTHDAPAHEVMNTHRNWALTTLAVLLGMAAWGWVQRGREAASGPFLGGAVLLLLLVLTTAWFGGELVYRHGIGVMSLPEPEPEPEAAAGHTHPGEEADHGH